MINPRREGFSPPPNKPIPREHSKPHHQQRPVQDKYIAPQPLGDKCNPLCPLFKCNRNAFFVINKPFRGRAMKTAQCRLTGSDCIGGECQYASCGINSLLPNGKCAKALEKKTSHISDEELFRKMMQVEEYDIRDIS